MSILHDLVSGGGLSRYYEFGSFLIPNVGMDVIVLALMQIMPVETAATTFIALTLFLMISGATYLHRSLFRADDLTPFIVAILTYNSIFTLGFLNYLFGIGLMLWCVGFFIRMRERPALVRFGWGFLAALALLFAHLAAFGVYALIVAGMEIQANSESLLRRPRTAITRLVLSALPLLLIVGLFYLLSPTAGVASSPVRLQAASFFELLQHKFWLVRQTLSGHENTRLDFVNTALVAVLVVVAFIFAKPRLAKEGALAIVLLCLVFLAAPGDLLSGSYFDARLPIAIVPIAACFTDFSIAVRRRSLAALSILFVVVAARTVVLAQDWARYDKVEQQFVEAFRCLPAGSILFAARADLGDLQSFWRPPIKHFPSLATVTDGIFVPATWAHPAQQPVHVRPHYQDIYDFQDLPEKVKDAASFARFVDAVRAIMERTAGRTEFAGKTYVMLLEPRVVGNPHITDTTIVAGRELFSIYRLDDRSIEPSSRAATAMCRGDGR